jgi:NTE family protein
MAEPRARPRPARIAPGSRPLNLALQGGGAHGAFTWGVLDALLEDGRFHFDGLCGTSSGAMNAVALAEGLVAALDAGADASEAREAARQSLRRFWTEIGTMGSFVAGVPLAGANPWLDVLGQWISPYQANPFDFNPLQRLLERQIDFERLRRQQRLRLFVNATHVRTGQAEVFSGERISADAVMASACLPASFKAVEIEGEHYWDGGYCGNPPLHPLIYRTETRDVLLVQIAPSEVEALPRDAAGISERVAEITFNAGLLAELRVIRFVHQMLAEGKFPAGLHKDVLLHHIDGGRALAEFGPASKVRFDSRFIRRLFELGRDAGGRWLEGDAGQVGLRSSVDLSPGADQRYAPQPPLRSRRT